MIELVGQISGCDEAVRSFAERLYRETEGNPLFLIEIVKSLLKQGKSGWSSVHGRPISSN